MPRHGVPWSWDAIFVVTWCYFASCVTGQCVMVDQVGFRGSDNGASIIGGIANFDDCKEYCLAKDDCAAVEYRFPSFCTEWTDTAPPILDDVTQIIALKECSAVECSVTQTADVDASNHAFEVTISSYTTCQDTCKILRQCEHAVYVTATNTCNLYNTTSSTTPQSGHMSAVKKACPSGGEECCFDETTDQTRSDSPTVTLTTSLSSCEEFCLSIDNCNSSVFTGSSCKIFTEVPVTTSVSGSTLSQKFCPEGASTGDVTYTTDCDAEDPTCSLSQTADTDGSNHAFEETSSYDDCKDTCSKLSQCQQAIYITASSTCHLYNTKSTPISQSGHMSAAKQACSSGTGQECCFNETTDESRSDSPTLTLTTSLSTCEGLCLSVDTCQASVFTGSICKIFTEAPETFSAGGRTLSLKSCSDGASPGNFTYTSACDTGSILASLSGSVVLTIAVVVTFCIQSS